MLPIPGQSGAHYLSGHRLRMLDSILSSLAGRVEIAHHIPGRVRLRLRAGGSAPAAAVAASEGRALLDRLRALEGVRAVSVNPAARSCTVEYDAAAIPPRVWDDLAAGRLTEEVRRHLARALGEGGASKDGPRDGSP